MMEPEKAPQKPILQQLARRNRCDPHGFVTEGKGQLVAKGVQDRLGAAIFILVIFGSL